jgi:hypothetical protein
MNYYKLVQTTFIDFLKLYKKVPFWIRNQIRIRGICIQIEVNPDPQP